MPMKCQSLVDWSREKATPHQAASARAVTPTASVSAPITVATGLRARAEGAGQAWDDFNGLPGMRRARPRARPRAGPRPLVALTTRRIRTPRPVGTGAGPAARVPAGRGAAGGGLKITYEERAVSTNRPLASAIRTGLADSHIRLFYFPA
ncbi:hypothetical protein GCM10010324_52130 [Streptomyces hiroshimensis]|uniref:Uncharacterized protein n=1 Tax=Streptomyces hiroshimensis TaxID=66424 RepID=A0ABQ2Z244_9ACTN|nr:hypothetical protein GCM10010324_52130 [Streptomyces hiroshimensis]